MDVYALVVWDGMGHAGFSCGLIIILLVSLAWEAQFRYLGFGSRMFIVDYLD